MSSSPALRLVTEVLTPLKEAFIGKEEIIDLLGIGLAAGENVFLLGPPGTAKSAILQQLSARLDGRTFDYLLTRFTEPNELFGPFDIRRLRDGDLVTNTDGMLPEADLVFLDELLNANSALLNSLLTALNERVFRRGRETRPLQTVMFTGASNHLPDDPALGALFDRFLLRVRSLNVPDDRLTEVLDAGWKLQAAPAPAPSLKFDDIRGLQAAVHGVDLAALRHPLTDLVRKMRTAGIAVSDRRAVKLQRLCAASALLSGRNDAGISDLWVCRHIWDTEEQIEVLSSLTDAALAAADASPQDHPRARASAAPDAEALARELAAMAEQSARADLSAAEKAALRDRLGLIESRAAWVAEAVARDALAASVLQVRQRLAA